VYYEMEEGHPERVGPFRLRSIVGEGATAFVYDAILLGRHGGSSVKKNHSVAIKVPKPSTSHDIILDEALIGSRARHPNLVRTRRLFVARGTPCIEMERIQGERLDKLTINRKGRRPVPVLRAAEIVKQAALGLHQMHKARSGCGRPLCAVHGDVKLSNILITSTGRVKVCDFGTATFVGTRFERAEDTVYGTPMFMSPEQVTGQHLDARSDVFVLGTVLYQLVMARVPFVGSRITDIMMIIAVGDFEDQLRMFKDRAPLLAPILKKCWHMSRSQRFSSAHELYMALRQAQEEIGSSLRGAPPVSLREWVCDHQATQSRRA